MLQFNLLHKIIISFLIFIITILLYREYINSSEISELNLEISKLNEEIISQKSEIIIKEQSINILKVTLDRQNDEIEKYKIDSENKQIIYKDKIQYITKTIEVEREVVKYLTGDDDCKKSKEIIDEIINH